MPYWTNLWKLNPETGLPDVNPYPKAGSEQGTMLPDDFVLTQQYPSGRQSSASTLGEEAARKVGWILEE